MKKLLLLLSISTISTFALAQKGSWYLGGLAGFYSNTDKNANGDKDINSGWTFSPEFGTFLKDDIQLGIALGFSGSNEEFAGNDISTSSMVNPTLYGRKFFKITDNFSTFGGLYLTFISGSMTDKTGPEDVKTKQNGFGLRLGAGIAYALSPRFTAVGQYGLFGFTSVNNEVDGNDAGSESSYDFGVNTVGGGTLSQGNGSGAVFNIGLYYTICQ